MRRAPVERKHEGALPAAGAPAHAHLLPGRHCERYALEHRGQLRAVTHHQILDRDGTVLWPLRLGPAFRAHESDCPAVSASPLIVLLPSMCTEATWSDV